MKFYFAQFLLGAMVLAAPSMSAAITDTGKSFSGSSGFVYSDFTYDHKAQLFFSESEDIEMDGYVHDFVRKIKIVDKNLNEVRNIQIPGYPVVTATYTSASVLTGPVGVKVDNSYCDDALSFESKDDMVGYLEQAGFTRTQVVDGVIRYLFANESDNYYYYYPDIYGSTYPQRYYIWDEVDSKAKKYEIQYGYEEWGPTGVYGEEYEYTDVRCADLEVIDFKDGKCAEGGLIVSQTLFNDDSAYEWVIPEYTAVDISREDEHERVTGKQVKISGFKVMSENGTTVADVKFPSGFYSRYLDLELLIIEDKVYMIVDDLETLDEENYCEVIYEVTPGASSINMVESKVKASVRPTAPHRGTPVNVEFGEVTGERCTVAVVSLDGKTVMSRNIEAGTTSTSIDTNRMSQGVYVVTITDERGSREATKIVVR